MIESFRSTSNTCKMTFLRVRVTRFYLLVKTAKCRINVDLTLLKRFPCIVGPEVTQAIKMMDNASEINAIFLEPLNPSCRSHIIFAVNDNKSINVGGTHWSLCVFSRADDTFYHFDSASGSNNSSCFTLVKILKECLGCESAVMTKVPCLQQNNSYDCGIFVICHTDLVCRTIVKGDSLESIKMLQPKNVQIKRDEVIQIIQNLKENM